MRNKLIIVFCLGLIVGILVLAGCEGEQGPPGPKGERGRGGITGIDPELLQPGDRNFGVGVVNGNERAVNGDSRVLLSFDSTLRATPEMVVAARFSNPPLIDGFDGEEAEWGLQESHVRLALLNSAPGLIDPQIYQLDCRAGWDESYIYQFFQWKERKVTSGADSSIYETSPSDVPKEMFFDARRRIVEEIDSSGTVPDTTYFKWIRVPIEHIDTIICLPNPSRPGFDTCYTVITYGDTNLVWLAPHTFEDKLAVFWGDGVVDNEIDLAFREFFDGPGAGGGLPADLFVDVWIWGSATTDPATTADDWSLTSSGKSPDVGSAPFIDNYILPDSVPRYQRFQDPNSKSNLNLFTKIYPFWYFDADGYSYRGWDPNRPVYLPGYVTTIPSGSRADIYAKATFDLGSTSWTLEIRRARRTYNGDDVAF